VSDLPLWLQILLLLFLLALSGFFSISETSMMAINRYRLQARVQQGSRAAALTKKLLSQTDRLLSTLLLGNNILNTAITAVVTSLTIQWYGNNEMALGIATAVVAFAIIIFAEITPKVIGAAHPEKVALPASFLLTPFMKLFAPAVWLINLFVARLMKSLGLSTTAGNDNNALNMEELRSMVLESGHFLPQKPKSILLNLIELEDLTVDDIMTPRSKMEYLNNTNSLEVLSHQISTAHHNKLPIIKGDWRDVAGILHVRSALSLFMAQEFDEENLQRMLTPAYFIPTGTSALQQLNFFQENRERLGLVVDEYGEVMGLVTPEDILEQLIGEFTSRAPYSEHLGHKEGESGPGALNVIVDGSLPLRKLNRLFQLDLPLDGPKTLNGLVLEHLQEIPEAGTSVRIGDVVIEVVQSADKSVKTARLHKVGPQAKARTL
jgi:Mg2+/Co2+ transporter CorB